MYSLELLLAMVKWPISESPPPKCVATSSSSFSSLYSSVGGDGSLWSDALTTLIFILIPTGGALAFFCYSFLPCCFTPEEPANMESWTSTLDILIFVAFHLSYIKKFQLCCTPCRIWRFAALLQSLRAPPASPCQVSVLPFMEHQLKPW